MYIEVIMFKKCICEGGALNHGNLQGMNNWLRLRSQSTKRDVEEIHFPTIMPKGKGTLKTISKDIIQD
jgi:hypothetical protein